MRFAARSGVTRARARDGGIGAGANERKEALCVVGAHGRA